ncbi:Hypothetical_protein [Hexamita inflata]|uniref:Hypothetical_protein n=1 Tax=Hexamita inflata TaxID=28002 RepID=A0AA86RC49_9EUKA|nr:Hypothetical protein HINF_LOCUS61182 [Hexamita inflata]
MIISLRYTYVRWAQPKQLTNRIQTSRVQRGCIYTGIHLSSAICVQKEVMMVAIFKSWRLIDDTLNWNILLPTTDLAKPHLRMYYASRNEKRNGMNPSSTIQSWYSSSASSVLTF